MLHPPTCPWTYTFPLSFEENHIQFRADTGDKVNDISQHDEATALTYFFQDA
jgi:hypothetical protein